MVNKQGSIDGNMDIGAAAVFVTEGNNFDNNFEYDDEGNLVKMKIQGRGGRAIDSNTNLYTLVSNQPVDKNYPFMKSAEFQTPVRVLHQLENGNIRYEGLWKVTKFKYCTVNEHDEGPLSLMTTLVPWKI
jgi:hypothetical protein